MGAKDWQRGLMKDRSFKQVSVADGTIESELEVCFLLKKYFQ